MQLRPESSYGLCVLQVRGRVGDADTARLVDAVCGALDDHPRGVVVDLERVAGLSGSASSALRELVLSSARWPQPSVVLCSPTGGLHAGLTGVEVHADRESAVRSTEARPAGPSVRVDLREGLRSPAQARAAVAALSDELGLADLEDDVTLIVSEIVTNAFRHATPPVALEIHSEDHRVLVSVEDGSADEPQARTADDAAEGGRGLLLVDLLCEQHGVRPDPPGKTVWAALSRRRDTPPTPLQS